MKKSIVKREERLCVSKGGEGGGVYMRKSIVRWRKRDYMSQQRGGGGGGEKEEEYFGGSIQKFFCYGAGAENK